MTTSPATSTFTSLVRDPLCLYFIPPNENTSLSLISKKINGECSGEWKRSMIIALSMKNKIMFIDGSLPKHSTKLDCKANEQCNDIIISYVFRSLEPNIS